MPREGIYLATNHAASAFGVSQISRNLPFAPASFDTILNLFSPSNYQEFDRILKPGGQVIKVVPAASYLKELRQAFIQMILQNKSILMNVSLINFLQNIRKRAENGFVIHSQSQKTGDWTCWRCRHWSGVRQSEQIAKVRENPLHEITVDIELLVAKVS